MLFLTSHPLLFFGMISISITRNNHKFDIYFLIINFYCSYFSPHSLAHNSRWVVMFTVCHFIYEMELIVFILQWIFLFSLSFSEMKNDLNIFRCFGIINFIQSLMAVDEEWFVRENIFPISWYCSLTLDNAVIVEEQYRRKKFRNSLSNILSIDDSAGSQWISIHKGVRGGERSR